jgi:ankyrin repeat protein
MNIEKKTLELFELVDNRSYTEDKIDKVKALLSEGADPNYRQKEYPNETILYRVISCWYDDQRLEIVKLLFKYGVDFNMLSDIFYPLATAVGKNDIALVEFMLENGVNQGLDYALKCAIESDNIAIVTLLLTYDVDLNVFEPFEESYLTFCSEAYRCRDLKKQYEVVPGIAIAKLLIKNGADPNGIKNDSSPILEAIRHDFFDLIDCLLESGAITAPLIPIFKYANTVQMFDFLMEKGVIKNVDKIGSENQETALIYHSQQNNIEIVKYLIEKKANLYHVDIHQKTAFHYVLWSENINHIDFMLEFYDVKKCHAISSVLDGIDNKKIISILKTILEF